MRSTPAARQCGGGNMVDSKQGFTQASAEEEKKREAPNLLGGGASYLLVCVERGASPTLYRREKGRTSPPKGHRTKGGLESYPLTNWKGRGTLPPWFRPHGPRG